jgi:hypothetical protein
MTRSLILPDNVDTDGNLTLLMAPKALLTSWPPKLTDLAKFEDVTYSLTTDGWNHTKSQEDTTDERLTLRQVLGGFGKVTHTIEITYFYGTEDDVVDPLVIEGQEIAILARYATPWEKDFSATDLWDVFSMVAGTKRRTTPAANGKFTKVQALKPRREVLEDLALAA